MRKRLDLHWAWGLFQGPGRSIWSKGLEMGTRTSHSCSLHSEPSTPHECLSRCQAFPKNGFISFPDHPFGVEIPTLLY